MKNFHSFQLRVFKDGGMVYSIEIKNEAGMDNDG